jgi:maleamate amidohydrolase
MLYNIQQVCLEEVPYHRNVVRRTASVPQGGVILSYLNVIAEFLVLPPQHLAVSLDLVHNGNKIKIGGANMLSNSALLVLDVQKDFLGKNARMPVAKHQTGPMLDRINEAVDRASAAGIPVVYIGNEFVGAQWIENVFRRFAAMKGSPGAALDERLHRRGDLYFPKKRGDALSNPHLPEYLADAGIRHLIITGLFAEGCVAATVRGARKRGLQVTVLRDAVAGGSDARRDAALRKLEMKGISMKDTSEMFGK